MSRSLGGTSLTTRSPIFRSPAVISSRPAIIRRLVVLPHPEGPTRTMNSPSLMARFRLSTAMTSPYFLVTFSNVTVDMFAPHTTGASRVLASSHRKASWTDPVRGAGSGARDGTTGLPAPQGPDAAQCVAICHLVFPRLVGGNRRLQE